MDDYARRSFPEISVRSPRERASAIFIVLSDSALESWMQYLADQAVQVRELVAELTLEEYEGGIEYGFQTAEEM